MPSPSEHAYTQHLTLTCLAGHVVGHVHGNRSGVHPTPARYRAARRENGEGQHVPLLSVSDDGQALFWLCPTCWRHRLAARWKGSVRVALALELVAAIAAHGAGSRDSHVRVIATERGLRAALREVNADCSSVGPENHSHRSWSAGELERVPGPNDTPGRVADADDALFEPWTLL